MHDIDDIVMSRCLPAALDECRVAELPALESEILAEQRETLYH